MIDDIQHVSITCRNLERSVGFYERLGIKVIKCIDEVKEEGIAQVFGLPRGHLKVAYLAPPQATSKIFIDLVQWLEPPSTGEVYPALNHVGINRLALRVSDIDTTTTALQERGIIFLSQKPQFFGKAIRNIVTTDPDRVFIQLIEGL